MRRHRLLLAGFVVGCLVVLTGCGGSPAEPPPPPPAASPTAVATHAPALGGSRSTVDVTTGTALGQPTTRASSASQSPPVLAQTGNPPATPFAKPTSSTTAQHALKEPLRLQFTRGEQRRYTQTMRSTFNMSMGPLGQRVPAVTLSMTLGYEVLDVARDGSARLRSTIERLVGSAENESMNANLLEGMSLIARVGSDGSYSDTQLERGGKVVASGRQADRVASSLLLFPYLNGPILVGDTFKGKQLLSIGQDLPNTVMDIQYTLADITVRDGLEVARLDERGELPELKLGGTTPGVEYRNGKGSFKGSVLVSTADGWPVVGDAAMDMSFELKAAEARMSGTVTAHVDSSFQLEYQSRGQTL